MATGTLLLLMIPLQGGDNALGGHGHPVDPLSYVDAGQGLSAITWDGGGSELEFADVNDDGHPDLLSIGDHGSPFVNTNQHGIMAFLGNGRGSWSVVQTGNFGYGGIACGDVNGDGLLDVGYGMHHNYSGTDLGDQLLEVALGNGTGEVWIPWDDGLATNGETWGMSATDFADVDNDGRLDVGSNSFGCCAGVHVYRNLGDGTWVQTFGFLGGNADFIFEFGDVNGDGNADLVAANSLGNVWRGDGQGGFVNIDGNLPGTASSRGGFAFGDVDGDGRDELGFVIGGDVEVWELVSGATWAPRSTDLPDVSPIRRVQLADMDADGFVDVAGFGGGELGVWRGDGGQRWEFSVRHSLGTVGTPEAFRADGDIDHNGRPDVAVLQDESCGLFCSRNRLYVLREASRPRPLRAQLTHPRGRETWVGGSVRTVRWLCGIPGRDPGTVDVQLSTRGQYGPWTTLAAGVPNDGVQQVTVPEGLNTARAFVRIEITTRTGPMAIRSPRSFRIRP